MGSSAAMDTSMANTTTNRLTSNVFIIIYTLLMVERNILVNQSGCIRLSETSRLTNNQNDFDTPVETFAVNITYSSRCIGNQFFYSIVTDYHYRRFTFARIFTF